MSGRQADYQWRLREVMAGRGIYTAAEMAPLLADRGITLSPVQVWRLITGTPERLSLPVLAALCDILETTPTDLIAVTATDVTTRRTATATASGTGAGSGSGGKVTDMAAIRPRRARITNT